MSDTIQSHILEFESGVVTASGFKVLDDAEAYGAAASIGAASACIARLWHCLEKHSLSLFVPGAGSISVTTAGELKDWCEQYLPLSSDEFLRRSAQQRSAD